MAGSKRTQNHILRSSHFPQKRQRGKKLKGSTQIIYKPLLSPMILRLNYLLTVRSILTLRRESMRNSRNLLPPVLHLLSFQGAQISYQNFSVRRRKHR
ncbi:hypothetical protein FGO68_gene860 [Halteria grandinella]|uniref:Uncharacterized protein n=1 Tax=Halteria grandinella TaxID=5974 RepID=A0A8J8NDB4_HALGN|nr:hypothetical protein FGO68_gene860 [Halteria grandinella]